VAIRDTGTQEMRLYVNGSLADATDLPRSWQARGPLIVGDGFPDDRSHENSFTGEMRSIRIYDRVLTDAEVQALYTCELRLSSCPSPQPAHSGT
ncbi:MAG: LamG domain-containing protein, partial [Candidatus Eremiobacteraeota bacterium]|nr:LamG domain-containing protein [Candidatus Eremiobacteraeota bacterium]